MPLLLLLCALCAACSNSHTLSDFKSDACSLFPDRSLILNADWCDCCYQHDLAYWQGGTRAQRLAADEAFRDCILQKTQNADLAEMMYKGVRWGGNPYFYNWYRWGYGWDYSRKYKALSGAEKAMVAEKLKAYRQSNARSPCK